MTDIPADAVEDVARALYAKNPAMEERGGLWKMLGPIYRTLTYDEAATLGYTAFPIELAVEAITIYLSHIEGKVSDYEAAQNGRGLL